MRESLLQRTRETLARAGYFLSSDSRVRPISFDVVARRDGHLVLVKVLTNVDSLSESVAQEIRVLAEFLNASAVLVGERSSSRALERGAVYARHGIPIMTPDTLEDFLLEGQPPLVFAAPGGFYVNLDGQRLRRIREERGISLGQLAEVAGVSRRAISMYEEGMGAMVEVAQRIEEFLDEALIEPVDPFAPPSSPREVVVDLERLAEGITREVLRGMEGLGFRVAPVEKGPFQGVAAREQKAEDVIITGVSDAMPDVARTAATIANICEVAETSGAFFVREFKATRINIEGLPLLGVDELRRMDDASKVLDLIEERRTRRRR